MRVLKWFSAVVLLASVGLCMPAAALASQKKHVPLTDAQIKAQVEHKVSELDLGTAQVSVAVKDGVVTLSGTVPSLWIKQEAIDRARKADDVASVVSDLSVMKAESDNALANEVATNVRRYVFYTVAATSTSSVNCSATRPYRSPNATTPTSWTRISSRERARFACPRRQAPRRVPRKVPHRCGGGGLHETSRGFQSILDESGRSAAW